MTEGRTAREAFEGFLNRFYTVLVFLKEHERLDVPDKARPREHTTALEYGLDMAKPIPDLEVTDEGIKATLSFSCEPVKTCVPWEAVIGMRGIGERPKQRPQLRAV